MVFIAAWLPQLYYLEEKGHRSVPVSHIHRTGEQRLRKTEFAEFWFRRERQRGSVVIKGITRTSPCQ